MLSYQRSMATSGMVYHWVSRFPTRQIASNSWWTHVIPPAITCTLAVTGWLPTVEAPCAIYKWLGLAFHEWIHMVCIWLYYCICICITDLQLTEFYLVLLLMPLMAHPSSGSIDGGRASAAMTCSFGATSTEHASRGKLWIPRREKLRKVDRVSWALESDGLQACPGTGVLVMPVWHDSVRGHVCNSGWFAQVEMSPRKAQVLPKIHHWFRCLFPLKPSFLGDFPATFDSPRVVHIWDVRTC